MTHDEAFAAMQARKRANEAAAPPRVTWRRVSADTGGGLSGLGPDGILVWVGPARPGTPDDLARGWAFAEFYDFGRLVDGVRVVVGASFSQTEAKKRAATLAVPYPLLSMPQTAVLEFLCAGLRASASLLAGRGVRPRTLEALYRLGLIRQTRAGARGSIYHLTDLGRAVVRCANENNNEGGPTMSESILTAPADVDAHAAAPAAEETPAAAEPVKRPRGRKDAEQAVTANKPQGPSPEMKALYKEIVTAIKALARGAKTEEKSRYLRIGNADGKTLAYVNFPSGKHVRVCIVKAEGGGEEIRKVAASDAIPEIVTLAQARFDALKAAKDAKN